jgi:UDP-N-acetylglucosamine:LPS N-acetylglucosamine transferase
MSVLLVGGFGGHGEQLIRIRGFLNDIECVALLEKGFNWPFDDRVFYVDRIVDYHEKSIFSSVANYIAASFRALRLLLNNDIDMLISTGPALSVPICFIGKLMNKKVVHIESWSRINSISNTTALILKFRLANVVAYQYKDSILNGRKGCEYWGHL